MCDLRMVPRSGLLATMPIGMDRETYADTLAYYRSDIEKQLDELARCLDVLYDSRQDPFMRQLFHGHGVKKAPTLYEDSERANQGRRKCIRMLALKCMQDLLSDVHKLLDKVDAINDSIRYLKEDVLAKYRDDTIVLELQQWEKDLQTDANVDRMDLANLIVHDLNHISEMSEDISKRLGHGIKRLLVVKQIVCRWNEWITNTGTHDQVMNDLVVDLEECVAAASGIVVIPLRNTRPNKRDSTSKELLSMLHSLTNVDMSFFEDKVKGDCAIGAVSVTNWKGAKQARKVVGGKDIGSDGKESASFANARDTTESGSGTGSGQSTNEFDKESSLIMSDADFMADCFATMPMTEEDIANQLLAMVDG